MINKEIIAEKVKTFLVNEFEIPEERLLPNARLREDVGIDSLDIVDIIVSVHNEFGIRLQNDDMKVLRTLDDFYNLIEKRMAEK